MFLSTLLCSIFLLSLSRANRYLHVSRQIIMTQLYAFLLETETTDRVCEEGLPYRVGTEKNFCYTSTLGVHKWLYWLLPLYTIGWNNYTGNEVVIWQELLTTVWLLLLIYYHHRALFEYTVVVASSHIICCTDQVYADADKILHVIRCDRRLPERCITTIFFSRKKKTFFLKSAFLKKKFFFGKKQQTRRSPMLTHTQQQQSRHYYKWTTYNNVVPVSI